MSAKTDLLGMLVEDWREIAVLLRGDAADEYGIERARLCERADVYVECARQLARRLGQQNGGGDADAGGVEL